MMSASGPIVVLAAIVVATNLLCLLVAGLRLRRPLCPNPLVSQAPPVTVVRPVRGIETFSRETLASGLALSYPAYETIFCVADARDPIIPLVEELISAHPQARARILVGDVAVSANPKLNNCVRGWDEARTDWVVLADSNVLMPPDYIQRLLMAWRDDSGLVCSTPAGSRPDGFWAEVECAFLNTFQARWQYAAEAVGFGFAQGKSMLWNKRFLDAQGGIAALGAEIAEDAAATKLVRGAGRHVHLVGQPFEQPLGRREGGEVIQRQFRWARLRRVTFLPFFLPEIFSGPLVPALAAAAGAAGLGFSPWLAVLAVVLPWYAGEMALARVAGWHSSWRMPLAFLVRDIVFPCIWAYAFVARDVSWRGNTMKIRTDGRDELNAVAAPVLSSTARDRA